MRRNVLITVTCLLAAGAAWFLWPRGGHSTLKKSAAAVTSAKNTGVSAMATNGNATAARGVSTSATNRFPFRLSNTTKTIGELEHDAHAILLENAFIDTTAGFRPGMDLKMPSPLQSSTDPGAYIVQSRGVISAAFRAELAAAGAQMVSYIPNNAYLVRLSAQGAGYLQGNPLVQSVLPYEPYYKISGSMPATIQQKTAAVTTTATNQPSPTLLELAVKQKPLPAGTFLTLGLFGDTATVTIEEIKKLGGKIISEDRSPFGKIVRVQPPTDWIALANLPGVQIVEPAVRRKQANDLSRVTTGVATNSTTPDNYLGLTGRNVLVEVNDTGIDVNHPDLSGRVFGDFDGSLLDTDGHGTFIAGIIAGSGEESTTVTYASGSTNPGTAFQYRGKAPAADLFSVGGISSTIGEGGHDTNAPISDGYFQEVPALTNALISNNSWENLGDNTYDLSAASYDAAVRDALPGTIGSQPVLFVFPAGNEGGGDDGGIDSSGNPDTIASPGTAKNVITVGALEQLRNITNIVTTIDDNGTTHTSVLWGPETDSGYQVAGYSSRGNVGVQTEGEFGRFKPDVVAPGTFVVSTRSGDWDTNAYYNPTNYDYENFPDQLATTNVLGGVYGIYIPQTAVGVTIQVLPNALSGTNFPSDIPIYLSLATYDSTITNNYDITGNNSISIPPASGGAISAIDALQDQILNFAVVDPEAAPLNYNLLVTVAYTNNVGDEYQQLADMNDQLGPYYRYETGTSMASADVSGVLALMQDFFTNKLHTIPSPALLKAMLINGARSPSLIGDFQVDTTINYQGWGLVNLPNSIPAGITNGLPSGADMSEFFEDQSVTNVLATGDSRTYHVALSDDAVTNALRITLAWTDPAGNPAAAIKLVNNLELVVTNVDDPTNPVIFYGNDIGAGSFFNTPETTNSVVSLDNINNVQNVYIPPNQGTNFSVTVIGAAVNVNAVTAQTNNASGAYAPNIVQDYALVISSGDGANTDTFHLTIDPIVSSQTNRITVIATNNSPLINQFVGASSPLLGTNTLSVSPNAGDDDNAVMTIGQTNQYHFYVITNTGADISDGTNAADVTNAAFVTFLPNTAALPREGVFAGSDENSTRPEADIDIFVSTDPSLLNLNPEVLSNCIVGGSVNHSTGAAFDGSSLSRGGSEFVVDTNSVVGEVYYVAVQSEDQMASQYEFLSEFSSIPFSQVNSNGDETVQFFPVVIPDGVATHPGFTNSLGLAIFPVKTQRVVLTNILAQQNAGDLVVSLNHSTVASRSGSVTLMNHTAPNSPGTYIYIYDDSGQNDIPGAQAPDGPGSLQTYATREGQGIWLMHSSDNAPGFQGQISGQMFIEKHRDLKDGINVTIQPGEWYYNYVEVPVGYINLNLSAVDESPNAPNYIQMYERYSALPTTDEYDQFVELNNSFGSYLSNSISVGPPLPPGIYYVGLYNPDSIAHDVYIKADLLFDANAIATNNFTSADSMPINDDAVTTTGSNPIDSSIFVTNFDTIQAINVGLMVDSPRISDLAFTLISPDGSRYLLMENRGGTSTNGAGGISLSTNTVSETDFAGSSADYTVGGNVDGWIVLSNQVSVETDPLSAFPGDNNLLALAQGTISNSIPTVAGKTYTLTLNYRGPGIVGWWRGEGNVNDAVYGNNGIMNGTGLGYTNGVVGQAFIKNAGSFNAGYDIPDSPNYILTNSLSIEGWVRPRGDGYNIFWRGDVRSGYDSYHLSMQGDPTVSFGIANSANENVNVTGTLTYNNWHHVAATLDNTSSNMSLYVDGVLVGQTQAAIRPLGVLTASHPGIGIGDVNDGANSFSFLGDIDEISLYSRALSASEVKAIYQAGTNGVGKFDANLFASSPAQSLAEADVIVAGISNNFIGENTNWQQEIITFTATNTSTPVIISGVEPGMLLDDVKLTTVDTNYAYLTFTEDTNLTTTPIKFAPTPLSVSGAITTNYVSVWANTFDGGIGSTTLYAGASFADGWHVDSGSIDWLTNGFSTAVPNSYSNANYYIDSAGSGVSTLGAISTNIATIAGKTYILTFAYARNPDSKAYGIMPSMNLMVNGSTLLNIKTTNNNSWANLQWGTTSVVFTATSPLTSVVFSAAADDSSTGVLLDGIDLLSPVLILPNLDYLPEQSLDPLIGTSAYGPWQLEVWDSRAGASNDVSLLSWNLQFTFANTNYLPSLPITTLTNGVPLTHTIVGGCTTPGGSMDWYRVNVPYNADIGTNFLLFADAPVNVWFSPNFPPTTNGPGDILLFNNETVDTSIFSTNGSTIFPGPPVMVPAGTYYLGIQNTNCDAVQYGIEADFHLIQIPPPLAFTEPATFVTGISAQLNGMATPNGVQSYAWYEWGTNTLYGNQTLPVSVGNGNSVIYVPGSISNLVSELPYHYRLMVSNAAGVTYGFDHIFDNANEVAWGAGYLGQTTFQPDLTNYNVTAIAAAHEHSMALLTNGLISIWGDNTYNQTNVPPDVTNVVAIAGGDYYSMALKGDGTVASWGENIFGTPTNVPPQLTNLTANVVQIAGGDYAETALKSDGTITSWGISSFGLTNIPPGLSNVVAIAGGGYHNVAVKNDGTVVAWGDDSAGQTNVPAGLTNVVAIAAGEFFSLALRDDGRVVAWGDDSSGQTNVPLDLTNAVAIAAGGFHSMALRADGTLVFWGDNSANQANAPAGLTNVVAISAGYLHSMALTTIPIPTLLSPTITPIEDGVQINGITILPSAIQYYQVDVPTNVDFTTNILLYAHSLPLNVWWTTNVPPTIAGPNDDLIMPAATNNSVVLSTNGIPPLVPGGTYYLGVNNTNSVSVNYGIEVDFHYVVSTNLNQPPVLPDQTNRVVDVLHTLTVTNTATDATVPAPTLTYTLTSDVVGTNVPVIDSATGVITWTPDISQAGTSNWLTTVVTDNGSPALSATNSFAVIVNPLPDVTVTLTNNGVLLTWYAPTDDLFKVEVKTNLASGTWIELTNNLSYSGPLTPTNGLFSYFDDGTKVPFVGLRFYNVELVGVTTEPATNLPPVLPVQTNRVVNVWHTLTVTNTATDVTIPAPTLTYTLASDVVGTNVPVIDSATGVITWMPDILQAGTSNWLTTVVSDNGSPALSATNSFAVIVNPLPDVTVTLTNNGVLLTWYAPTDDLFKVEVETNLVGPWIELTNNLGYSGPPTPTNGLFSYLDDYSQVPDVGLRFYNVELVGVTPENTVSNTVPISNVVFTNGNFTLTWTAPTNDQFQVKWSTNLIDWLPFPDIITSPDGMFQFTDTNSPSVMKFYELYLLP